jgi:hypothetical protein
MEVNMMDSMPEECRGVDFNQAVDRLPGHLGELFLTAGEQRLAELDKAMASGNAPAVMDAAHSLASITGLLPIRELEVYAREIYAAGERNELATAKNAHERLDIVMGWVLGLLRIRGTAPNAS